MNVRIEFCLLLFFIVTGSCWIGEVNPSQCNHSTFEKLLYTLYKNVEFMHTKESQLNLDAAFGLTLAEANLETIMTSDNWKYLNDEYMNLLLEIRELSRESREYVENNLETEKDYILAKVLTKVDLWMRSINWKNDSLMPMLSPDPSLSESEAEYLIHAGTPRENESDYCLMQLINQYLRGNYCRLSDQCVEMITKEDGSRGYALAHRLLITQVANALNCERYSSIDSNQLIGEYCKKIYQDLLDMEAWNFPGVGVDLAIEQIFLCGMEGYSEFVTSHYRNFLLNLPNSLGCYSARGYKQKHSNRTQRSSNPMDFGCDNHTCGVAAAALSLLLRECIAGVSKKFTLTAGNV